LGFGINYIVCIDFSITWRIENIQQLEDLSDINIWTVAFINNKIYILISVKKQKNIIMAWDLNNNCQLFSIDGYGRGVLKYAVTKNIFFNRIIEINSKQNFTQLWDAIEDNSICRFYADAPYDFIAETKGEFIADFKNSLVRCSLENYNIQFNENTSFLTNFS